MYEDPNGSRRRLLLNFYVYRCDQTPPKGLSSTHADTLASGRVCSSTSISMTWVGYAGVRCSRVTAHDRRSPK